MTLVLVVDDNRQMVDGLCRMLDVLGVDARPVYGPRSAMLALQKVTPDVVLMDINMPGLSGFEVQAYLKREPRLADVRIIFVTSDDQPETAARVSETGALGILIKPVSLEGLENIFKKFGLI